MGFNSCQVAELTAEPELCPLPMSICEVQDLSQGSSEQNSRWVRTAPKKQFWGTGSSLRPLGAHHIFADPTPGSAEGLTGVATGASKQLRAQSGALRVSRLHLPCRPVPPGKLGPNPTGLL